MFSYFYIPQWKKKIRKIQSLFEIEKWLWKPELCHIWPSIPNRTKYLEIFMTIFKTILIDLCPYNYLPLNSATLNCLSEVTLSFKSMHFIFKVNLDPADFCPCHLTLWITDCAFNLITKKAFRWTQLLFFIPLSSP